MEFVCELYIMWQIFYPIVIVTFDYRLPIDMFSCFDFDFDNFVYFFFSAPIGQQCALESGTTGTKQRTTNNKGRIKEQQWTTQLDEPTRLINCVVCCKWCVFVVYWSTLYDCKSTYSNEVHIEYLTNNILYQLVPINQFANRRNSLSFSEELSICLR